MPVDPTIKAALEAAERELTTARKIEAFLRALPVNARATLHDAHAGQITSRPGVGQTGAWWAGHLAAAVEEAARDG